MTASNNIGADDENLSTSNALRDLSYYPTNPDLCLPDDKPATCALPVRACKIRIALDYHHSERVGFIRQVTGPSFSPDSSFNSLGGFPNVKYFVSTKPSLYRVFNYF